MQCYSIEKNSLTLVKWFDTWKFFRSQESESCMTWSAWAQFSFECQKHSYFAPPRSFWSCRRCRCQQASTPSQSPAKMPDKGLFRRYWARLTNTLIQFSKNFLVARAMPVAYARRIGLLRFAQYDRLYRIWQNTGVTPKYCGTADLERIDCLAE